MEPASKLEGGWLFFFILISCATFPVAWWHVAKRQIGAGKKGVVAHSKGFVVGFLAFFSSLMSLAAADTGHGQGVPLMFWAVVVGCLWAWSPKPVTKPLQNPISDRTEPPKHQPLAEEFTGEGSDLIRKHTGKQDDDYVADLLADIDVDARPKRSSRKLVKYPVIGSIAFDYIDTKHELSSRVVNTKEVDARHISGYCLTARAFRTFLIEGIVSDVTDTETGEVMPVDRWIKQAKKAAKAKTPKK